MRLLEPIALLAVLLLTGCATPNGRRDPVRYDVQFPNLVHHEAQIAVTLNALPAGPLELRMSRSSPGRYAIHEFAKNVLVLRVEDGAGRELPVERPDPYSWLVSGHGGTVRVSYRLFADRADGTYSGIDRAHAHLNPPATFLWARGLEDRAVSVHFAPLPEGWSIATQLAPGDDPLSFTASDLQAFMDSPIEIGPLDIRSWTVASGGREQTIRLAIHHAGTADQVDAYVDMLQRVVREQEGIFGELPVFDHGVYTFIADYLPHVAGDGMEHRNSTILASTLSLEANAAGLLGTASHEFFHAWNVERVRPASLEPFDFTGANMSGELWLAEGFTSYYGPLAIHRAGLSTLERYAASLAGGINTVLRSPGRGFRSPREMSMMAPFVDAATAIDPTNFGNTFISYYTWGAALGLALDLTLRSQFRDLTADDFMRELWRAHGATARPYTNDDARAALARVTGSAAFAEDFWFRFIDGRRAPDFAELLARAGLLLRPPRPDRPWLGDQGFSADSLGVVVRGAAIIGTPLYRAGLDRGDRVLSLGGRPLRTVADVDAAIQARRPGDSLNVQALSRGLPVSSVIVLEADPRLEVVTYERAGREVSDSIRAFRAAWLGSRVGP